MKNLRNERGIALVTALLLTLVALLVVMAVFYLITQGIQVSAAHKKYKNVLEASYGGVDVFTKDAIGKAINSPLAPPTDLLSDPALNARFNSYTGCFQKKLLYATSQWSTLGSCGGSSKTVDPKDHPDMTFTLQGLPSQPGFIISSKIVDTVPGNSDTSGMEGALLNGAGVAYGNSGVSPQHLPATYRIEVQGERAANPLEKARLTVLYAW